MEAAQLWKQWKESRIGSKSDRATKLNKVGRHHFKFEIREHHFYWVFDISLWLTEQEQELTVARCSNLSFKKTSAEISISVAHFKALLLSKIQIVCWSLLFFCWLLKVNLSVSECQCCWVSDNLTTGRNEGIFRVDIYTIFGYSI